MTSAAEEEEELKKSAVVNWYLKEIESEIDSEEELVNKKGLIEKVIHRLVHYVSTLCKNTDKESYQVKCGRNCRIRSL